MQSSLLSLSGFGKFYSRKQQNERTIELSTLDILQSATFNLTGERLYLLDRSGNLACLVLKDNSLSTFSSVKLAHHSIQSSSSYSIYGVSKKSQLHHISFEDKKSTKVMGLNVGRVINFQKNHFTNLLLVVQLQIIMIIDLNKSTNQLRSIKATNGDTFSGGCFLNKNRLLVLAVNDNELRVVEVSNMKVLQKIFLNQSIKGMKIEASIDGSTLAIYGDLNKMFIGSLQSNGCLKIQETILPILSILQLKFTCHNHIIFLANNRILYAISPNSRNQLVQLFNSKSQHRFSSFDVSLDTKSIALIANKTVHILSFPQGIRYHIKDSQGTQIEFIEMDCSKYNSNKMDGHRLDNEEGERLEGDVKFSNEGLQIFSAPNLPEFNKIGSEQSSLLPQVNKIKASSSQKIAITKIYNYLHQFEPSRTIVHLQKAEVAEFIHILLRLHKNHKQSAAAAYHILNLLSSSIKDGSLQKYALILAPRIFERIQKYEGEFVQFITKCVLNLFKDYLQDQRSCKIVEIILKNRNRQSFLPIFIISLLLQMRTNSQSWPFPHIQNIDLNEVLTETENLMTNPQKAYLFAKETVEKERQSLRQDWQDLQVLLKRQQQLKQSLQSIRNSYE